MWPFRKKRPVEAPTQPTVADQIEHYFMQQADMQRRLDEQVARIAAMPMPRVIWTPVIGGHGGILALAWKNDRETAVRLLEEPAEGRA
jgi:hypothetical protein